MKSLVTLISDIAKGETTSEAMLHEAFAKIDIFEPWVRAFLSQTERSVLMGAAQEYDHQRKKGLPAKLGIPIAIKDNIAVRGAPLTAGSRVLEGLISPYDATVVSRLHKAGFLCIGKTNLDEWAFGSSTEHSAFYPTANPHDASRVPGGSSGGSGAVVSYGGAVCALGSETGGSIRSPAAYCGIYGLKPTYGRVSRFGLVAFGSSLDQIGPMGRSIADVRHLLHLIEGKDPLDETSGTWPVRNDPLERPICIGIPDKLDVFLQGCDDVVVQGYHNFLAYARSLRDVKLVPMDLTPLVYALPIYYIIAPAEASSNLSRYDGVRYGRRCTGDGTLEGLYSETRSLMGQEAKLRILIGTFCLSAGYKEAYYDRATTLRGRLRAWMCQRLQCCHALAIPTAPTVAFRLGEKKDDPLAMYRSDIYAVGVNLTEVPSLSCPVQVPKSPLPIGIQFIGGHGDEDRLCAVAEYFSDYFHMSLAGGK